jgi:hypothetical protein
VAIFLGSPARLGRGQVKGEGGGQVECSAGFSRASWPAQGWLGPSGPHAMQIWLESAHQVFGKMSGRN